MSARADIPETVMEEAIGWFDDIRGPDADRQQLAAWLMRSPTHIEALISISALHGGLSSAAGANKAWLESLIDEVQNEVQNNVLPLDQDIVDQGSSSPLSNPLPNLAEARPSRRRLWSGVGLAAAVLVTVSLVLVSGWLTTGGSRGLQQYVTTLGEQRAIVLNDGSVMQLNTNSAVTVQFTEHTREIVLTAGEAMFDVKKDPNRPFRVQSGDVTVEAIGTRFNVYHDTQGTVVTVIEGKVAVDSSELVAGNPDAVQNFSITSTGDGGSLAAATFGSGVALVAGEQLAVRLDGAIAETPVSVDTQRTTAWIQRRVVFEDDSLASVIAEFNRYNRVKLVITDALLRERRISGIFTVDDPETFVEVLASMAPIKSIQHADGRLEIVSVAPVLVPVQE